MGIWLVILGLLFSILKVMGLKMTCLITGRPAEIHHIYTRKSRPDCIDETWNHMPLCREKHTEIHTIGRTTFIKKYRLSTWMLQKGWSFDPFFNKWFH